MKINKFGLTILAILIGISAISVLAQDRKPISQGEMSKYIVSAKAGVVNIVEGEATVTRVKPLATQDMLISGDELLTGDTVKTGPKGRVEVLLNPGSYLRAGGGTEFVFLFDSDAGNIIKLLAGSAVIEASALDDLIFVETPKAKFQLSRVGLYRFNVPSEGKAEVAVSQGRVLVGETTIKQGKRAVVEGNTAAIAKLSKQDLDGLDSWSKNRAQALIAANSRLSNRGMTRTLGMSFMYNAWIYDPMCRCYTFLPFAGGFASPYGYDYSVCNPYWAYYSNRRYNNGGYYGGNNGGGNNGNNGGGNNGGGGSSSGGGGGRGNQPPSAPMNPPPVFDGGRGSNGGIPRGSDVERSAPRRP